MLSHLSRTSKGEALERSLGHCTLWSPHLWVCDEVTGAGLGATAGHSAGQPALLAFGRLLRITVFFLFP